MRIGILGGSFDPVHTGHIELADRAMREAKLDKVIFVPTAVQPFKPDAVPASSIDRLEMLRIATEERRGFEISRFEIDRKGISYTIDTLRAMRELYRNAEIFFIVGIDAFVKIEKWKEADELLKNFSFIVGVRPGYDVAELDAVAKRVTERCGTRILRIKNPQIDISSTEIREYTETGALDTVAGKIPERVREYILKNEVYN